jgi:hypothetical protein
LIKMMILAPRRTGMTHPEFRRYVTEVHGPLVKSVEEVAADIRHYHYNFPVAGAPETVFGRPVATHIDIVTEAWFDSIEAQKKNMEHPRYMQIIRPDEHRFAGVGAVMHYAREVVVTAGESLPLKVFCFRRRKPGLSRKEFQVQWLDRLSSTLSRVSDFADLFSRYVQNQVKNEEEHLDGADVKYFDVIDEFCIRDLQIFAGADRQGRFGDAFRQVEEDLLDMTRNYTFLSETIKNIP